MSIRFLDHLVLPVAGLAVARARYEALGFTVAPEGVHPFGTANACVYLADGTFLEPLAVSDRRIAEAAAQAGNSFVLGDRRFRAARGEEGLSALVFKTPDAEADHEEFRRLGVAGGGMVEFSRPAIDRDGKADTATFRLAFAAHDAAPDLFFFACERRKAPAIDRTALERHPNTAARIVAVTAAAAEPEAFAGFLATVARGKATAGEDAVEVALANAALRVRRAPGAGGALLTAIAFGVADLAVAAALFRANGVVHEQAGGLLRVPSAPGQGVDFVFEEMP